MNTLRARGAPRMPPDRPLNEADIRLIEQWILDGARRDVQTGGDGGRAPSDSGPDADDASGAEVGVDAGEADAGADAAGDGGSDSASDVPTDGVGGVG